MVEGIFVPLHSHPASPAPPTWPSHSTSITTSSITRRPSPSGASHRLLEHSPLEVRQIDQIHPEHIHSPPAPAYKSYKISSPRQSPPNPLGLVHLISFAFLAVVLVVQFLVTDSSTSPIYSRKIPYSSTSFSPSATTVESATTCESPHPFHTQIPTSSSRTMSLTTEAARIAAEFEFTDSDAGKVSKEFLQEMQEGLAKNNTTLSQIPTYVTGVPNGTEKGLYLAVDLGGTNFRVCSIQLNGDTTFNLIQSKVAIPKELMVAKTATELFSFLAKQIDTFLRTHHADQFAATVRRRQTVSTPEGFRDEHIFRLGFTFSFPIHQTGINSGTLMRWTKGFDIADAIGQDVCALLQREIDILKLPVKVAALVNDTVGTLMARSYTSPGKTGTLLGAIFGTGTNGAYVEKLANVTKPMEGEFDKSSGEMVVNTEWGSFDNGLKVLPTTVYDAILDKDSVNPGIQMFEKRISGMFLGEILRIVLVNTIKNPHIALFRDDNSSQNDFKTTTSVDDTSALHTQWAVDSSILSIAEADNSPSLGVLRQEIEKSLGVNSASIDDARFVKAVAKAIATRAARLSGVAMGAIIIHTGRLLPDESSVPAPASSGAILQDIKNLKIVEAAGSTIEKLADTAGLSVNEDEIVDIGVDGSLVEFYPGFEDIMRGSLRALPEIGAAGERRIRIGIAKDGSGVGAALIALVAAKMEAKNNYIGDLRQKLQMVGEEQEKGEGNDEAVGSPVDV